MSVKRLMCGECDVELVNDTITKENGETVQVSKCRNGHGMIKSPTCCGHDMECRPELI
ncbi:MAG: Uncharacterized protein K0R24_1070 [Gammaproteobacteria bacterium]|nr:Uncharacterized protein [Gammaproteobacteria bacterium]MCE3238089.1 Uncharacterized protein [Gammaproteobacteria bacterium]